MDVRAHLQAFLQRTFLLDRRARIGDDDSFLERGFLDSTGVLELVSHLESTFGVTVEDEEIVPENLDSIRAILRFLERKGALAGGRS